MSEKTRFHYVETTFEVESEAGPKGGREKCQCELQQDAAQRLEMGVGCWRN